MRLFAAIAALLVGCDGSGEVLARIDGAPMSDAPDLPDTGQLWDDAAPPPDGPRGPLVPSRFATAPGLIHSLWADDQAVYWATEDTVTRCRLSDGLTLDLAIGEETPLSLHGDPSPPTQTWLF